MLMALRVDCSRPTLQDGLCAEPAGQLTDALHGLLAEDDDLLCAQCRGAAFRRRARPLRPRHLRPRRRALDPEPGIPHPLGRSQRPLHLTGVKHFHHPVVGEISLNFNRLELAVEPGLTIFAYTAEPGSRDEETLKLLGSWAATRQDEDPGQSARSSPSEPGKNLIAPAGVAAVVTESSYPGGRDLKLVGQRERSPGRHRRPLFKSVWSCRRELATPERTRTAAAVGRGGVEDQVDGPVAIGHCAQRPQNCCLIEHVDLSR